MGDDRRKYRMSGWLSVLFVTTVLTGWLAPWHEEPPDVHDCTSVVDRHDDPEAVEMLREQGYRTRSDELVPSGCEGQR